MTATVLALGVFVLLMVIAADNERMRRHSAALAELRRRRAQREYEARRRYFCDCSPAEVCTLCTPDEGRR